MLVRVEWGEELGDSEWAVIELQGTIEVKDGFDLNSQMLGVIKLTPQVSVRNVCMPWSISLISIE